MEVKYENLLIVFCVIAICHDSLSLTGQQVPLTEAVMPHPLFTTWVTASV